MANRFVVSAEFLTVTPTGIRVIVTVRKELAERGAALVIDGLSGAGQQVLEVSGLLDDLTRRAE